MHNEKMVEEFPLIKFSEDVCTSCLVGKHTKKRYEVRKVRIYSSTLDLIQSDVYGMMPTTSMNGSKYFLTFIDDNSRYCWIYFLKQKSEVFETFKIFKSLAENTLEKNTKEIISDNGGEYIKR